MYIDYINEAFKNLDLLTEDMFDTSPSGINNLSRFMDEDDEIEEVRVIDADASDEDDIQDSYIGKVIINCNVCHSHVFENKDEIVLAEDGFANMDVPCPYCGQNEGFTIVGEIAEFNKNSDASSDLSSDETQSEESENIEESLNEGAPPQYFDDDRTTDEILSKYDSKSLGKAHVQVKWDKPIRSFANELGYTKRQGGPSGITYWLTPDNSKRLLISRKDSETISVLPETKTQDVKESLNEGAPHKYKPHTMRLLRLIGSDLVNDTDLEEGIQGVAGDAVVDDKLTEESDDMISKDVEENSELTEDFKEVSITTDDQHMEMTSDDSGKVSIVTEPIQDQVDADSEMIVPVSAETESDIIENNEESSLEDAPIEDTSVEDTPDNSFEDVDFEDIDETTMDELGESYLKRVYENVDSFKTANVFSTENGIIVEGVIGFTSGSKKTTKFLFESADMNDNGQVRFIGTNKHLTESQDAYSLVGHIENKKLFVESLKYNYRTPDSNSVRGVVRKK